MDTSLRERLTLQVIARAKLPLAEERDELEGSLLSFVEGAWPSLDPSPYQSCWAIDALCEHLQAVTEGQIKKLLVNFPPRCGKTLVTSVCFPAFTWARSEHSYLSGPQVRFLCGSYNDDLSLQNSTKHRRLLLTPWYQRRWGKRFKITRLSSHVITRDGRAHSIPDHQRLAIFTTAWVFPTEDGAAVGNKVHPGLLEPKKEMSIAAQPVQLGDNQFGTEDATRLKCLGELQPIVLLAALDLHELLDDLPVTGKSGLGLEAQRPDRALLRFDRLKLNGT